MKLVGCLFLGGAMAGLLVACGASTGVESPGGSSNVGNVSTSNPGNGGGSTQGFGSAGSSTAAATGGSVGSTPAASSGTSRAGSTGTTGSSSARGSTASSSSGGTARGDAGAIACGAGLTCEPPMECCDARVRTDAGTMVMQRTCVATGQCPMGGIVMECSSELSCATGDMCCRDATGATTCAATCAMGATPVCETNAGCPAGDRCVVAGGGAAGACQRAQGGPRDAGPG